MWETAATSQTSAPPEAVWALWEDPARWPEWNDAIAAASLAGPFAEGTLARVRFRRAPLPMRFTITRLEPRRLFVDEALLPGARLGHEHRLERSGETTAITHRLYLDGAAAAVLSRLMGPGMRKSVREFGERERALAEAAVPAKGADPARSL